jgi:hypothetical protein
MFEYKNSLTEDICETIIDEFNEENCKVFKIPKNNSQWERIERTLYKEILVKINEYKLEIISDMNKYDDLSTLLNKVLYTKHLIINKLTSGENMHFIPNRYNVLTYVFFLNTINEGGDILIDESVIKPEIGKLVIFREDIKFPYKYNSPINEIQYIISGQLCYDNIV